MNIQQEEIRILVICILTIIISVLLVLFAPVDLTTNINLLDCITADPNEQNSTLYQRVCK